MELIPATDCRTYPRLNTAELRQSFLISGLFVPGAVTLKYWETDRTVIGGAVPLETPLALGAPREVAAAHFCERRELGVVNVGGAGAVVVDGATHALGRLDTLYIGRGAADVRFQSANPAQPAHFYLLSYPAHATYPTTAVPFSESRGVALGSPTTANERVLHKIIHPAGVRSCQLVMGYTLLQPGAVWNTMPPHTHLRRSEVYLYFDVPADAAVLHLLGEPRETRHLLVHDREVALSPSWSIHSGVGTANYGFIWGMGGENQEFADMDMLAASDLR